jgi:predicted amidophosphoribosyltransferase
MCVNDAPKVEQELGQMQSAARMEQLKTKVDAVDMTGDINVEQKQRALCPHCGAEASVSGKFCENCGQKLTMPVVCAKCGTESERGTKFCPECGNNLLAQG